MPGSSKAWVLLLICSFIHRTVTEPLYVPGSVLGAVDTAVNATDKALPSCNRHSSGVGADCKQPCEQIEGHIITSVIENFKEV